MTESSRFPENELEVDSDHMVETTESLRDRDPEVPPMDRGTEATDRPVIADPRGPGPAVARPSHVTDG
jgi:hypothetical protein